jgi:uncharacterized protein YjdB
LGASTPLSSATPGGNWTSSNTSTATVTTTGTVTGIASGTAVITYTAAGCGTTTTVSVIALPAAGAISGTAAVCPGTTTTLTGTVAGGTWLSSDITIADVDMATGIVTGIVAGTTTISYTVTNACGSATITKTATVNSMPVAGAISGTTVVCEDANTDLDHVSPGYTWSSSNTAVATVNGHHFI